MAGWFYPPPPPVQTLVPLPQGTIVQTTTPPPIIGSGAGMAAIRSAWPVEQWGAQRGAQIAGMLAITQPNYPQPQPFVNVPLLQSIRGSWPAEAWGAQFAGGSAAQLAQPPPPNDFIPSPALFVTIRASWPVEQWAAQTQPPAGGITAPVQGTPNFFPSPPLGLFGSIRSAWPEPDWRAQSECAIASGIAQIQLPPLYISHSDVAQKALIQGMWLAESWAAQKAPATIGFYPPPVTAVPSPIPHKEIMMWPQEAWAAQAGSRLAAGFAIPPAATPFISISQQMAIRLSWPSEDWRAQHAPPAAAIPNFISAIPYTTARAVPISLWPVGQWPAQRGAQIAGFLAPIFTPTPPIPVPINMQPIIGQWPQPSWPAQAAGTIASLFAIPFNPPGPTVPSPLGGGRVVLPSKKLGETINLPMDFISRLAAGETILSAVVTAKVYTGNDPSPQSIVTGTAGISGTQVIQGITGGVLGTIYEVLYTAQTSAGQRLELTGYLAVVPDLP